MPFKLTKTEVQDCGALIDELRSKQQALTEALDEFNEALATLSQWAAEIADKQTAALEKKNDEYQESDEGRTVAAWVEALSDLSTLDQVDLDLPDWEDAVNAIAEDPLETV